MINNNNRWTRRTTSFKEWISGKWIWIWISGIWWFGLFQAYVQIVRGQYKETRAGKHPFCASLMHRSVRNFNIPPGKPRAIDQPLSVPGEWTIWPFFPKPPQKRQGKDLKTSLLENHCKVIRPSLVTKPAMMKNKPIKKQSTTPPDTKTQNCFLENGERMPPTPSYRNWLRCRPLRA